MKLVDLAVPGPKLLLPDVHRDGRGFFVERWRARVAGAAVGLPEQWAQDNHSRSTRGVLRGLHYQLAPHAQGKLVGVTRGRILDVAVDVREGSSTFGRHVSVVLDDEALGSLWVPPGFAHGFLVLSEVADVSYKVSAPYAPEAERGVRWDDPALRIDWRTALGDDALSPRVSAKDSSWPLLADADLGDGPGGAQ